MALSKDIILNINDFDAPMMVNDADAWTHIIIDLIFVEPGTYSDSPDLGIAINEKKYMEVGELIKYLQETIMMQVHQYFTTIPLTNVILTAQVDDNGNTILVITLDFNVNGVTITKSAFLSLEDELITYITGYFDS